ncbi:MAG: fasciclin domain-containing protein [Aggregatilineales bacterium]
MQRLRFGIKLAVIIGLLLMNPVTAHQGQPTIIEILCASQDSFSNLLASFEAADAALMQELSRADGNYTFFAPTNAAFDRVFKLLQVSQDQFLARPDVVREILAYHVVPGRYSALNLEALDDALLGTMQPVNVYLELETTDDGLRLDGTGTSARLFESDILAANGIVHVIDGVLLPYADWDLRISFGLEPYSPSQSPDSLPSLGEVLAAADDLSLFHEAAQNIDPTMLMGGRYTIFAPTNAALEDTLTVLGMSSDEFLQDSQFLWQLFAYHMMPGSFNEDLLITLGDRDGQRIASALPGTTLHFTVNWRPIGETPDRILRVNDANVMRTDPNVRNGILYVIDRVLMPPDARP